MTTTHVRSVDTEDRWLLYDAREHILGRMAAQIARQLMGKDRPTYTPSEPGGTHVVVIHGNEPKLSGKKSDEKLYKHYTGYPGGLREVAIAKVAEKRPSDIVTLAVRRMLPKNRLGRDLLRRLKVYSGKDHPHTAQQPVTVETLRILAMVVNNPWTWGLGRRKKAIARVRLKSGSGGFVVNGRPHEQFFPTVQSKRAAEAPLLATETVTNYDVFVNVHGGGLTGQSEAVALGIARALKTINPSTFETLREHGLLTRDAREKERKKYGRRGARRGFQFSKR